MLTPSKIKNHHFEAVGKNAYRAQSVDDFFEIVADSYEQMFKENGELVKKLGLLAERVEEYRNDEDNIRAALLTAQRMADQIMRETNEKAEAQLAEIASTVKKKEESSTAKAKAIVEQAENKANLLIADTEKKAQHMIEEASAEAKEQAVIARDRMIKTQAALDLVEKEADKFKAELLSLYTQHIELINKIPEVDKEVVSQVEEAKEEVAEVEQAVEETVEEPVELEEQPAAEEIVEEEADADAFELAEQEETQEAIEELVIEEPEEQAEQAAEDEDDDFSVLDLERLGIIEKPAAEQDIKDDFTAAFATIKEQAKEPVEEEQKEEDGDDANNSGFSFNIDSLKFDTAQEEDEDEFYDDDDDDDFYDIDDEDDDNEDDDFSSKLKNFFKR